MGMRGALLFAAAAILPWAALAQEEIFDKPGSVTPVAGHPELILIEGVIDQGLAARFAVTQRIAPQATTVVLQSPGGLVGEAVLIANAIRAAKMDTVILPDLVCNSSCVFIFAGGVNRAAFGEVGVHQLTGGGDIQGDLSAVAKIFADAGIASGLLYRMLATPHEEVYFLTSEEKQAFGLNAGHVKWLDKTMLKQP